MRGNWNGQAIMIKTDNQHEVTDKKEWDINSLELQGIRLMIGSVKWNINIYIFISTPV